MELSEELLLMNSTDYSSNMEDGGKKDEYSPRAKLSPKIFQNNHRLGMMDCLSRYGNPLGIILYHHKALHCENRRNIRPN